MPRYVILLHRTPPGSPRGTHWDLMLEQEDALRTWTLLQEPGNAAAVAAQELPDHRLAYLDYEGPLSGDRGTVARWDAGDYRIEGESAEEIQLLLKGERLSGAARLTRDAGRRDHWTFRLVSG